MQPTETWRTTGGTAMMVMDFGAPVTFDMVFVGFTNFAQTADFKVTAGPTQSPTLVESIRFWLDGQDYTTHDRVHSWILLDAPHTAQQVRLDIVNGNNNVIDVGIVRVGKSYRPTHGTLYGTGSIGVPREESRKLVSESGVTHPIEGARPKVTDFDLEVESEDELMGPGGFFEMARLRGTSRDIVVVPNNASNYRGSQVVYGLMNSAVDISLPNYGYFAVRVEMEELL